MQIRLICVGQKMPQWVSQGFQEYNKRLPAHLKLDVVEIALPHRSKNADISRLIVEEGDRMLTHISSQTTVVALDERGQSWTTPQLAAQLQQWLNESAQLALLVGGPDGLSQSCLKRARQKWSLSPLTLPHPLVRIVIAEQIYRAWSLLNHHPYHRD
ncbi:MAG: rRNA ((1915)-N(3))-methyltransferase RlmH [Pseudomonadota bacterium]|jgi:23S rRNA (pseudouridine1915-N3)-methyltransferase